MALVCLCDGGCGRSGDPSAFKTLGVVIKRQYCDVCTPFAQQFLDERDAAHSAAAEQWRQALSHLVTFGSYPPKMKLPDVADA